MKTEYRVSPRDRRLFVERSGSAILILGLMALGLYRTLRS